MIANAMEELPLAVCDVSSQPSNEPGDFLLMDLKYRDRDGEIYVLRASSPQSTQVDLLGQMLSRS